jgi:hypothetical protein
MMSHNPQQVHNEIEIATRAQQFPRDVEIEAEISRMLPRHKPSEPPNVGALSAEAMDTIFKQTTTNIEAMGGALMDLVKKCEQTMTLVADAFAHINETIDQYHAAAKKVHTQIDGYATLCEDTRRESELMRQRLVSGEPAAPAAAKTEAAE